MGFKSYRIAPSGPKCWRLDAPEPLMLSGRFGLIARHVLADPLRAARPWQLTAEELLRLSQPTPAADRWIVFEQVEGANLHLSRLERLAGVSGHETELLATFAPLLVLARGAGLSVEEPAVTRCWTEGLALDGGAHAPGAPWHWCSRPLNLGTTVLGPAAHR
jgi:hypothetical protein